MIELMTKKFIPNCDDINDGDVRRGYGALCGAVGIVLNLLIFFLKLCAGFISGSVGIMADAFNNLGDAGSSIIMMVGFRMAGQKPDTDHPFGHGRIEYVTGLVISMLIILMSVELVKSSVSKIVHPQEMSLSIVVLVILIFSIAVKLYMFFYNNKVAGKLNSATMKATARDSLSDTASTTAVLIVTIVFGLTGINLDGWVGLLVSAFILYTGVTSAKDTLDPLLGTKPDKEYVRALEKFVMSHENIVGIHDLVVHDYGPGRVMISLHAEVPANGDILELHDTIDNIEMKLNEKLGCQSVIHMDPVVVDDEVTSRMKRLTTLLVKSLDEKMSIHDFRMVMGPTHTNLVFDVLAPYEVNMTEAEIIEEVCKKVEELPGNLYAVVKVDRPMV